MAQSKVHKVTAILKNGMRITFDPHKVAQRKLALKLLDYKQI